MNNTEIDLYFVDDNGSPYSAKHPMLCGGFFFGRNNARTLNFIEYVIRCEQTGRKEQWCINIWRDDYFLVNRMHKSRQVLRPKMYVMSPELFPSGKYLFETFFSRKPGKLVKKKPWPVIAHNNWVVGHTAKVNRFKQHMMWFINEAQLQELLLEFKFAPNMDSSARELLKYTKDVQARIGFQEQRNSWIKLPLIAQYV